MSPEYYWERAAEAEQEAALARLPRVREQYLKAARSWSRLAEHVARLTPPAHKPALTSKMT
jgi:hypothetical protein